MLLLDTYKKNIFLTFNIKEKATRKDFWIFHFVNFLIQIFIVFLGNMNYIEKNNAILTILIIFYTIFLIVSSLTIGVRRLNYLNLHKALILACFIPYINALFYTFFLGLYNTPFDNGNESNFIDNKKS